MDVTLTAQGNPFASLEQFFARLERPGSGEIRKVATAIAQGQQDNFSNERSGDGTAWRPLAQMTILERIQQGYPGAHPILRRSGRLRDSLVNPQHPEHYERLIATPNGWTLEAGTNVPYALQHEIGEDRVPARPFTDLSDAAEQRVLSVLDFLISQIQAQTVGK